MSERALIPPSVHFVYRDGVLHADGVSLTDIAERFGTPSFVYSATSIETAYRSIDAALSFAPHLVAYAVKANGNLAVVARLAELGCGADIVSRGELHRCVAAGMPPSRIVFSGVGKTDQEIEEAIAAPIRSIHVESVPELDAIEAIARRRGEVAKISLRINPNVDAETHPYIATGLHDTKFGLELDVAETLLPRLVASEHLELEGVTCHVGSQLATAAPLRDAVEITARFAKKCSDAGAPIRTLDAGGGWPISYGDEEHDFPEAKIYGDAIREGIERGGAGELGLEILVEPGRALVGEAGVLLARVLFVKEQHGMRFVILDAAMTELIRPSLYRAHHAIQPVVEPPTDAPWEPADIVGPVCETGDFFARGRPLPPLGRGDLVAIRSSGAYGMAMASNYNARPRAAEVLVDGADARVVRTRERVEDLLRGELL